MPKRTYEEKIQHYNDKISELREKNRRKRRRRELSSSSSVKENEIQFYDGEQAMLNVEYAPDEVTLDHGDIVHEDIPIDQELEQDAENPSQQPPLPTTAPPPPPASAIAAIAQAAEEVISNFPALDQEMLSALGDATDDEPKFGEPIHDNLTALWIPLLKKGMAKEVKEKILKQYLVPSNCTMLQAPKLNMEISSSPTTPEMVKNRDKKVENAQQQLGVGIAAISRAMTLLLTQDNKVDAIKILSDGCRILCDLHNMETQARIKMITPGLTKTFLNVIQDSKRDETLFGANLPEKIKASKTIEQQSLQIRKPASIPRTATQHPIASTSTMIIRPQYQGNYQGPPRFAMSRGGRGGMRRPYYPTSARRQPAVQTSGPRASQVRPRAQPRQ